MRPIIESRVSGERPVGSVPQRLVLVRHGEAEGDIRRAAWKRGEAASTNKMPENEELTARGFVQCEAAGLWIQQHGYTGLWSDGF